MTVTTTTAILRTAACASLLAVLAGCSTTNTGSVGSTSAPPPPPQRGPAPEMTGRWNLSSPAGGACIVSFAGAPGAPEGTIRPEGGCPGKFFTSRKWTYEPTGLVIRDHNGEPLAQLSMAGNSFDGQSSSGHPVALTR